MPENSILAQNFLTRWDSGSTEFYIDTSGSTGVPKTILLRRSAMEDSARITGKFLEITPEDTIFCCLPVQRIGGLMQLVRSRIWDIPITIEEPSGNPLKKYQGNHSIISLTPMQLVNILEDELTTGRLQNFRIVLLGGADIPPELEKKTVGMAPLFYHTYGMTETCSHIAMRRLISDSAFRTLDGIEIRINTDNCLEIRGGVTDNQWIATNDIASLVTGGFKIIGRKDNIINSGGIKIQPEEVENAIYDQYSLPVNSIMLVGFDDYKLGKKVVLLVDKKRIDLLPDERFSFISEKPKRPTGVYFMDGFMYTENGKLDRNATLSRFLEIQ